MSPADRAALLLVLLGFATATGLASWRRISRRIWAPATLVLLLAATVVATVSATGVAVSAGAPTTLLVGLGAAVAIAGGGPITVLVFDVVDRRDSPGPSDSPSPSEDPAQSGELAQAGAVLRGGAWIGALERAAIYATLLAGWPEGLAVVLAVKGLGRYPELRAAEDGVRTGAAERFIIGTLASVLWACACAGLVLHAL